MNPFIIITEVNSPGVDTNLIYTCAAIGNTLPTITWTAVDHNNNNTRITLSNSITGVTIAEIAIDTSIQSQVTFADNIGFDEVECTATNSGGTVSTKTFAYLATENISGTTENCTSVTAQQSGLFLELLFHVKNGNISWPTVII